MISMTQNVRKWLENVRKWLKCHEWPINDSGWLFIWLVTRNDPWNVPQVYSRLLIYQDSWQWWKNVGGGKSTGSLVHSLLRWVAVLGARLAHRVVYTGVFHKISYSNLWFYSNEKMKLWQKISSGTRSLGSLEISSTFNFKIPKIL